MLSTTLLLPPLFSLYLSPHFPCTVMLAIVADLLSPTVVHCPSVVPSLNYRPPSCCCPALFLVDRLLLVDRGVGIVALHLSTIHHPPSYYCSPLIHHPPACYLLLTTRLLLLPVFWFLVDLRLYSGCRGSSGGTKSLFPLPFTSCQFKLVFKSW